jgi:hypothetical protein
MKIAILLVSSNNNVLDFFNERKGSIIPKEIRERGIEFSTLTVHGESTEEQIIDTLIDGHHKYDAVGALIEDKHVDKTTYFSPAIFTKTFSTDAAQPNFQNYFGHNLKRWLKNLIFLCRQFSDGKQKKCLLLPHGSFLAPELDGLFDVCKAHADDGPFPELLEKSLKCIRERSVPKKKKSGDQHFLLDDSGKYFSLGKEHHGQSETSNPPHSATCSLTAAARFGVSIDQKVHFNVSRDEQKISGSFLDCHGKTQSIAECSHINMFPNRFIR